MDSGASIRCRSGRMHPGGSARQGRAERRRTLPAYEKQEKWNRAVRRLFRRKDAFLLRGGKEDDQTLQHQGPEGRRIQAGGTGARQHVCLRTDRVQLRAYRQRPPHHRI